MGEDAPEASFQLASFFGDRAAGPTDALTLSGLQAGAPVTLNTRQWNTIDGLLQRMPQDDLGRRARSAWLGAAGKPASAAGPKHAAARLADDEQIIVVLDSQTGELRQCGNASGFCVGMNPWAKPVAASAPLALAKHADQLDAEARARTVEPSVQH